MSPNANPNPRNTYLTGLNKPPHPRTRRPAKRAGAEEMRPLFKTSPQPNPNHDLIPLGIWLRALPKAPQGSPSRPRLRLAALCTALALFAFAAPAQADFGIASFDASVLTEGGLPATQAGSHPVSLDVAVNLNESGGLADGDLRDLAIDLPPGLFENPTAIPLCSQAQFSTPRDSPWEASLSGESCPDASQVGTVTMRSSYAGGETRTFGLFNLAPPPGVPSQVGLNAYGVPIIFAPQIRQGEGSYGITLESRNLSQLLSISALELGIWGNPWSVLHNERRGNCLNEEEPDYGWAKCSVGRPAKTPATAYLTLPTNCDQPLRYLATARSWRGSEARVTSEAPALTDCKSLDFEPEAHAALINPRASSASGYEFTIAVDTTGVEQPGMRAPSPVRRAVLALPQGLTINPSVGAGLGVCSPTQFQAETPTSPPGAGCPNESKIGDFTVRSPIVAGIFEGAIFLASPYDNPSGSLIAVYLVAKNQQRGFLVKVPGSLQADPKSGDLTATFDRLPQLPYSELKIDFREGQRSPLATPPKCGLLASEADLTPWRNPDIVRRRSVPVQVSSGLGGGPCPQGVPSFSPQVAGGSLNSQAGAYSPFYLHLTRTDMEQEITSYSATFPPGLLGKLAGVPYCPDAAIAAASTRTGVEERDHPSCPEASRIGRTYSGYGLGSVLTYAPGGLYLAGPHNGAQVSVVAIDSALVGPFDLGVIVIRSAIRIDTATARAQIDATGTDPIPHIVKGIPIHLRDVRAYIDRPGFTVNPTSCAASTISSALNGSGAIFGDRADDSLTVASGRYQAFNCASLGFRPRLSLRMKGKTKRSDRPSLRVVVRPRQGEANIGSSQVTLPASIFLNQAKIDAICTRPQFAAHNCPPGSAYGEARAFTPLLEQPLVGKAYLRSSDNLLPDLVFALRGQGFEVDLVGRIDSVAGGLRATFPTVPDAPVTKFVVRMFGGKRGILENAANLCSAPALGRARFLAHSNRGWIIRPRLKARCGKKPKKSHKKGGRR